MRSLIRGRSQHQILWVGFALAAGATAWAVFALYDAVQREVTAQGAQAVQQELARAHDRVRAYTDTVRRTVIEELAGLHVDGLAPALRRWDEANTVITGTFLWPPDAPAPLLGETIPANVRAENLPSLWNDVRTRIGAGRDWHFVSGFHAREYRLLDNPEFPAERLGYQAENLELLTYAGRRADPWAGWAGDRDNPAAPWVVWYQPGPDAPVRGCFVDVGLLVAELRQEPGDPRVAALELGTITEAARPNAAAVLSLHEVLPAHALRARPGTVFLEKQSGARLTLLTAALLLAAFLTGAAVLVHFSRRDAREAERKTTFVSQVSHELRTPLTSIRMFADMLGAPALADEKRLRFAGTISRESQRLGALIERLLTFAALEKGRAVGPLAPVDVAAVVRESLEEADTWLRAAGLRVETDLPADAVVVTTDRSAVKQALLNLVDNAQKYAGAGGVVRVELVRSATVVILRVADRGPGIPRDLRARIFEPFVQGNQTLTDKSPGVGLGLSIARGLLRAAGGDVVLVSADAGATFEIRLPVTPSP